MDSIDAAKDASRKGWFLGVINGPLVAVNPTDNSDKWTLCDDGRWEQDRKFVENIPCCIYKL